MSFSPSLPRSTGDSEQGDAIAVELAAPDPGNVGERLERSWPAPGHFDKGRVMEDHVGRQLLAAGFLEAPGAQRRP